MRRQDAAERQQQQFLAFPAILLCVHTRKNKTVRQCERVSGVSPLNYTRMQNRWSAPAFASPPRLPGSAREEKKRRHRWGGRRHLSELFFYGESGQSYSAQRNELASAGRRERALTAPKERKREHRPRFLRIAKPPNSLYNRRVKRWSECWLAPSSEEPRVACYPPRF